MVCLSNKQNKESDLTGAERFRALAMLCILLLFAITSSFATSIPGAAPDGADEVITPAKGPSRLELKRASCVLPRPSQANECLRGGINREPTLRGKEHLEELVARVRTLLSEVQRREEDNLTEPLSPHRFGLQAER
jgi:hypothetical protein